MDKATLSCILDNLGQELDIPNHVYEDAVIKYTEVAEWLNKDDSPLKKHTPDIFPQGSFRLGTAVRPINSHGEYDIDLVCRMQIEKENVTQAELKNKVGNRLKSHHELKDILQESRRCWRLDYPEQFHMDILPAIPNTANLPDAILLTDTDLYNWQHSNPIAYAKWFYNRMRVVLDRRLKEAAEASENIEEVPEWKVRTPLQRTVQILKRHRDIYFRDQPDICPISIIITTLAAHSYRNQEDIVDTIMQIIQEMPNHIENRNGTWWVANPVEPRENFADKWNKKPEKRETFLSWIAQVEHDFTHILAGISLKESQPKLENVLGKEDVGYAIENLQPNERRLSIPQRRTPPQVPALANTTHVQELTYPIKLMYKSSISANVYLNNKELWPLSQNSIPKNFTIRFRVSTNTPTPYTIQWQIVNTGQEAAEANQLRGNFETHLNTHSERTGFRGTHWVEAFIVKDGYCVSRTGRRYVKVR